VNVPAFFINFILEVITMALVKFGGGIIQASGSIAGVTHARNRFGNYIRPRTKPVNPNSAGQAAIRTALSYLAEYWHSTLTAAQRSSWNTYAASVGMKNRLGEPIFLTGFNHFIRSNTEIIRQGFTIIADGPTELALPEKDTTFAVAGSEATQLLSVTFNNALPWATEVGGFMFVYQGVPKLVTRNYFGGPWRYADSIVGAVEAPTSPAEIAAGFTLTEGQKDFMYARIARADGRISEPFFCVPFLVGA